MKVIRFEDVLSLCTYHGKSVKDCKFHSHQEGKILDWHFRFIFEVACSKVRVKMRRWRSLLDEVLNWGSFLPYRVATYLHLPTFWVG